MNILGISACSDAGAVCLVQDGQIIATAQEDLAVHKWSESFFPGQSVASCLQQAEIDAADVGFIALDAKPLLTFGRILETYLAFVPAGIGSFLKEMPPWLKHKLWLKRHVVHETGFQGKIIFPEHHQALAAAAFFASPFKEAAFLTFDGICERATTSYGFGNEGEVTILAEMNFPHSLGLLYTAFTHYLGFNVNSGEDEQVMSAASGEPKYKNLILSRLMDLKEDGSFKLDMTYFDHYAGLILPNDEFVKLFGRPARTAGASLTAMDMDLACSIQAVTEEIIFRMVECIHVQTGQNKLCFVGVDGSSRRCVTNSRFLQGSSFEEIWVQPETGAACAAQGAALFAWHQYLDRC